jgi:periplasmic protein TonB
MVVLYGVSFALHASLGMGVTEIEPVKEPERIAITVVDVPKPKVKPKLEEPPPPPPPPPPPVERAPKKAAPRAKAAQPPPAADTPAPAAAPTFGIAMTGGVGMGGVAVPVGESLAASKEPAPAKRVAEAKTLVEPKKPASVCDEAASKPKPLVMNRPEYTEEARAAAIEGKVRVELTVDATGAVKNVKVLESLGHGLDEAALRAVQAASFEPAQQCGKPVSATFVVSIRFSL